MIFVALAVAWAVYLIPKALRHHDEVARSRSVERFSNTMRVLARREPVNKRDARLVVQPGRASRTSTVTVKGQDAPAAAPAPTPAQLRARRESTRRATARRRRVLGILLTANVVVAALATAGVFGWVWQAIPGGLLVAWLVACRVMVKSEIAVDARLLGTAPAEVTGDVADEDDDLADVPAEYDVARNDQGFDEVCADSDTSVIPAVAASGLWDPLPVTLPTYISKPAATRTVRTIDLGESGTWSSGHDAESTAIAREASATEAQEAESAEEPRRVVGG